ncbi:hypothetical protein UA08_08833 [Talaromyces atroroseus]|uniref:C2H2-type domain-containing protein n=1 Tax=Talaromyces atroroseus TaxID=1441469 RepID=A0A225ALK5_TALAT|nr:hypothetical protein UA08_08833 [Talaromyces atroroseus]OKL55806.1 hypothetical protein UA08_08833 [Talaromyces atroroseus]
MTTPSSFFRTILPHGTNASVRPDQFASELLERFARMEDLYRHAADSGEGHSHILRENRNREPRGFYNFFREALNLTEAHIDDWTICHMRVPDLFDPAVLMELLKTKKNYESAIALQDAIIMATSLRATCPICCRSFSLHATLKTHLRDHGSEDHANLLAEPDGRFDTGRVITEMVNSAWNPSGNGFLKEPRLRTSTTIYDVITGETHSKTRHEIDDGNESDAPDFLAFCWNGPLDRCGDIVQKEWIIFQRQALRLVIIKRRRPEYGSPVFICNELPAGTE